MQNGSGKAFVRYGSPPLFSPSQYQTMKRKSGKQTPSATSATPETGRIRKHPAPNACPRRAPPPPRRRGIGSAPKPYALAPPTGVSPAAPAPNPPTMCPASAWPRQQVCAHCAPLANRALSQSRPGSAPPRGRSSLLRPWSSAPRQWFLSRSHPPSLSVARRVNCWGAVEKTYRQGPPLPHPSWAQWAAQVG